MLISIAMATYNGEKFLIEQLESIMNQTYKNLEIIICDDGSNDNTVDIIKNLQKIDSRIKLYQNEKQLGVIQNFSNAISLCSGKYIAISDQDDIWCIDKIEMMLAEIGDCVLIYHDDILINGLGEVQHKSFFESNQIQIPQTCNTKSLLLDNWISGHACMFSSHLKTYILPISAEVEHYDMWIAIVSSQMGKIKYLNKQLAYWRQHGNNTSGDKVIQKTFIQKVFNPIDKDTFIRWNKSRIQRLRFYKNIVFLKNFESFIDDSINYYMLTSRLKAFIFALNNVQYLIAKKGFLRKVKYIFLPFFAPRINDD